MKRLVNHTTCVFDI